MTATIRRTRRAVFDKAKITRNRNHVLRSSSKGRLLLVLERCLALVSRESEMNSRRLSQLLVELRYARNLAEEAGVRNGWVRGDHLGLFFVFELSSGDIVFDTFNEIVAADAFPRKPIASSSHSSVLARAISEIMTREKNSFPRRSTRIPTDVLVEVHGDGFAYAGETITVNLHGALVRIAAPLKCGDRVTLHVHDTGKSATGAVVFANDRMSQFGIELGNPENIWGVAEPPTDWETPPFETA